MARFAQTWSEILKMRVCTHTHTRTHNIPLDIREELEKPLNVILKGFHSPPMNSLHLEFTVHCETGTHL